MQRFFGAAGDREQGRNFLSVQPGWRMLDVQSLPNQTPKAIAPARESERLGYAEPSFTLGAARRAAARLSPQPVHHLLDNPCI
jgi:hypothetical protein